MQRELNSQHYIRGSRALLCTAWPIVVSRRALNRAPNDNVSLGGLSFFTQWLYLRRCTSCYGHWDTCCNEPAQRSRVQAIVLNGDSVSTNAENLRASQLRRPRAFSHFFGAMLQRGSCAALGCLSLCFQLCRHEQSCAPAGSLRELRHHLFGGMFA